MKLRLVFHDEIMFAKEYLTNLAEIEIKKITSTEN